MFVLTFWSSRKNGLIRKIRLILKIMMSQLTITRHVLPNTSRRKDNQTMKFRQVIEYNEEYFS